jgi:hypothetical protein
LLAAHAAIKHFRHFCEGHAFQLWIDHEPLVTALYRISAPILLRQQLHLARFEKCCQFLFRPTTSPEPSGTVAATTAAAANPVNFKAMAAEHSRCAETHYLLASSLKIAFRQAGAQRLIGNGSTGVFTQLSLKSSEKMFFKTSTTFYNKDFSKTWG